MHRRSLETSHVSHVSFIFFLQTFPTSRATVSTLFGEVFVTDKSPHILATFPEKLSYRIVPLSAFLNFSEFLLNNRLFCDSVCNSPRIKCQQSVFSLPTRCNFRDTGPDRSLTVETLPLNGTRVRPLFRRCKFSHQTKHFCCSSACLQPDNGVLVPWKPQNFG